MFVRLLPPEQRSRHGESAYEYLVLSVSPGEPQQDVRRAVREHTESGRWELSRTLIYQGGSRRYWMRRRVMRVESSLGAATP